jgi:apolipoprotein N-acyltransferase
LAKSSVKAKAIHSGWWIKPGIALFSGALMWCAFSPLNIWLLAWVAPGILMWLIAHSKRARSAMLYAALHAAALYGIGVEWMRAIDDGPYIGLVLLETILFGIFGLICGAVLPKVSNRFRPLVFAAAWVCFEWARSTGTYAFPWFLTSTVFSHPMALPWLQAAEVMGAWGVSASAVFVSGCLVHAAMTRRLKPAILAVGLITAQGILGLFSLAAWSTRTLDSDYPGRTFGILVQGNEDRGMDRGSALQQYADITATRIRELNKEFKGGEDPVSPETNSTASPNPRVVDFVLWPEGTVPITQSDLPVFASLSKAWNTTLITGLGEHRQSGDVGNVIRDFAPDGHIGDAYAKRQLVPFGEFFPLRQYLDPLFEKYGVNYPNYTPGQRIGVVSAGGVKLGLGICYETAFGYISRDSVNAGATALAYVTSDQTYDGTIEQKQHFDTAVVRAVEVRRQMVRASSTGLTGVVQASGRVEKNPYGGSAALLPAMKPGVLDVVIEPINDITLYTRFGDWFVWCCWGVCLAAVGGVVGRRRR